MGNQEDWQAVTLPKLHVAVLMGGWSSERPVSLMSGEGVAKALGELVRALKSESASELTNESPGDAAGTAKEQRAA